MSGERADPFGDLSLEEFKPKPVKKPVAPAAIRQVSEASGFPSRAPVPPATPALVSVPKPLPRRRRTGRNVQLNLKVTADDLARDSYIRMGSCPVRRNQPAYGGGRARRIARGRSTSRCYCL